MHFSTDLWTAPQWLYDKLDTEFNFTVDVCATPNYARNHINENTGRGSIRSRTAKSACVAARAREFCEKLGRQSYFEAGKFLFEPLAVWNDDRFYIAGQKHVAVIGDSVRNMVSIFVGKTSL